MHHVRLISLAPSHSDDTLLSLKSKKKKRVTNPGDPVVVGAAHSPFPQSPAAPSPFPLDVKRARLDVRGLPPLPLWGLGLIYYIFRTRRWLLPLLRRRGRLAWEQGRLVGVPGHHG